MPESCCVVGCTTRRDGRNSVSLFRIPANVRKRTAWIRAIARKNWQPRSWDRVCGRHFVSGWPSDFIQDVDYRPTQLMKGEIQVQCADTPRSQRAKERCTAAHMREVAMVFEKAAEKDTMREQNLQQVSLEFHSYTQPAAEIQNGTINSANVESSDTVIMVDKGSQTDLTMIAMDDVEAGTEVLKQRLKAKTWGVDKIKDDDEATQFYTGLPSFAIFLWLFSYLQQKADRMDYWGHKVTHDIRRKTRSCTMELVNQFLFVLMRLKVGLFLKDLADRFDVSATVLSQMFTTWIVLMEKELEPLNPFPSRDITSLTLPAAFSKFQNIRCIIDCTELFIERASNLAGQSLTFSNYKHHTTVKFLVGIVPTGAICYVSQAWGGRVSDRCITEESGFLDFICKGDLVMADKGFTIGDLLAKKAAFLQIPPFLANKGQFSAEEVQLTKTIARARIHVERAIGRVKQFHILDPVVPISLNATISSIFRVCCFLSNLHPPLVK